MKYVFIILAAIAVLGFQNCSDNIQFSSVDEFEKTSSASVNEPVNEDPDVVCDPLDNSSSGCPSVGGKGLIGNLYYLTPDIVDGIGKTLSQTTLDDYISYGIRSNKPLLFSQVNITPRDWDSGFKTAQGAIVTKDDGEALFEWFAIHLNGYIVLPKGDWELAIISDDGMRVKIDGRVLLNDDSQHAPRILCSIASIKSDGVTKQPIEIKYFQGPRTKIAMQLLYRSASRTAGVGCDTETQWLTIGPEAYSH